MSVRREFKTYKTRIFGKLRTNLIRNASLPSVICIIHYKNLIFRRKYGTSWSEVSFDDFPEPEVKTDACKVFLKIRFYVQNSNNALEKKSFDANTTINIKTITKNLDLCKWQNIFFLQTNSLLCLLCNCDWWLIIVIEKKKCSKVSRKRSLLQFEMNGAFHSKVFTYVVFFICQ